MKVTYSRKKELDIFNKIKDDLFREPHISMWESELNDVIVPNGGQFVNTLLTRVASHWNTVREPFLNSLGKFYDRDLEDDNNLTCFLVRFNTYPYDFESENPLFCAPLLAPPAERMHVIMHELCYYYLPLELKREIKEAIPVILNDHEKFQMFSVDRGHDNEEEQEWRKKIWELYKDGGTIWDLEIS